MKQFIAGIFIIVGIAIVVLGLDLGGSSRTNESDFLRLHIRANSNSFQDQQVKYLVKQEIVNELTPIFSNIHGRDQAMHSLKSNLGRIEAVASRVLVQNGFDYGVRVGMRSEFFPTRAYSRGVTLPQGVYDALIIELGSGQGDNWWCVIYPPLCFLDNNIGGERGVVYRSRLQEIIRRIL